MGPNPTMNRAVPIAAALLVATAAHAQPVSPSNSQIRAATQNVQWPINVHEPTATATASGIKVTGKLRIHVRLKTSPAVPEGTTITVFMSIDAKDGSFSNTAGASNGSTPLAVSGGVADVTYEVPYIFQVASLDDTIDVSLLTSTAVTGGSTFYNGSRQFNQSIPMPKDGAVTTINFTGGI